MMQGESWILWPKSSNNHITLHTTLKLSPHSNAIHTTSYYINGFDSRLQGVCWTIRRRGARPMCLRVILQWVASTEDCQEVTQPATTSVIPTSSHPASYAPRPAAFTVYQVSIWEGVLPRSMIVGCSTSFQTKPSTKRWSSKIVRHLILLELVKMLIE